MALHASHVLEELQTALQVRNWATIKRLCSTFPTRLPKNSDVRTITRVIEEVRAAVDAIIQACDYSTAFEASFVTRRALVDMHVFIEWAIAALKGFSFEERVVSRIATMLAHLGIGSDGRAKVGSAGAVDPLTIAWNAYPTNVDIVKALVSLCSSHIDNISRTMRRRGITIAVQVLTDESNDEDVRLLEQTLLYLGVCAICTPDNAIEGKAVLPALMTVLRKESNTKRTTLSRHVLMAIGNILDCWTKEGYGYDLGDLTELCDAIVHIWKGKRRSKEIATSASWALSAMFGVGEEHKTALQNHATELKSLSEPWKRQCNTSAFLFEHADQFTTSRHQKSSKEHQTVEFTKIQAAVQSTLDEDIDRNESEDTAPTAKGKTNTRKKRVRPPRCNKESSPENGQSSQKPRSRPRTKHPRKDNPPEGRETTSSGLSSPQSSRLSSDRSPVEQRSSRRRPRVKESSKALESLRQVEAGPHENEPPEEALAIAVDTPIRRSKRKRTPKTDFWFTASRPAKAMKSGGKRITMDIIEISSDDESGIDSPKCVRKLRK